MRKKLIRSVLISIGCAALVGLSVLPAAAADSKMGHGTGDCGAHQFCLYKNTNYNGNSDAKMITFNATDSGQWWNLGTNWNFANSTTSIVNNGGYDVCLSNSTNGNGSYHQWPSGRNDMDLSSGSGNNFNDGTNMNNQIGAVRIMSDSYNCPNS